MFSRRGFLGTAALVGASAVTGRVQAAAIPEVLAGREDWVRLHGLPSVPDLARR